MKKIILFALIGILLLIIQNGIISIQQLLVNQRALSSLIQNLQAKKKEQDFLLQQLQYVKTSDFIEKEARNKLGMVKPGEYIVIAPPPQNPEVIQVRESLQNWQKWAKLFF